MGSSPEHNKPRASRSLLWELLGCDSMIPELKHRPRQKNKRVHSDQKHRVLHAGNSVVQVWVWHLCERPHTLQGRTWPMQAATATSWSMNPLFHSKECGSKAMWGSVKRCQPIPTHKLKAVGITNQHMDAISTMRGCKLISCRITHK